MSKCTIWDVLKAAAKYDGSATAHKDVINNLKKHGHSAKMSDAWCTETVMSVLYDAGGIGLVGGYASDSGTLKKNAEKLGIWKKGSGDILPGDIVLYGTKDGKTNHTELALGADVNLCGNYAQISKDTCQRRKRSGRTIIGRVRPKYAALPEMDNLQVTISACDVMLDVYGSGETREKQLSVFGKANAKRIQDEVTNVWGNSRKVAFDMAVYIISDRAGKNPYRKKRLGSFATKAQDMVDEIYALRVRAKEQAARDVIAGKYGKLAVREALLRFNGYNPEDVQAIVDELLKKPAEPPAGNSRRIRVWPIWFFEGDESQYGDATAIIQYGADDKTIEHCILIDTAKKAGKTVKKLKAAGIKTIDAVVISHAHGDHYGALTDVFENFAVKALYLPDTAGLDKYQKSYGDAIRNQEKKAKRNGASCVYLKVGKGFTAGNIHCDCIWQAPAASLSEHDDHHFVNNQSIVLRFTLGGTIIFHSAGDLQNEANNLLVKSVPDLRAHIFKTQWHGDANACNATICAAVRPKIAFSNYHHLERSGRGTTRKRLEAVGAVVARNAENGDIWIDCEGGTMHLHCSKGNLNKTIKI